MANIIDYVENELSGMTTKEFNAVDSLVLSQFAYIYFDGLVPDLEAKAPSVRIGDLLKAEAFPAMFHEVRDEESNRKLLFALAASPRFRNVKMNYYVDKLDPQLEQQFSAVVFELEDDTVYAAYRGTDTTFIGWKEDFNMAFISPIPSQEEGVRYLNKVAEKSGGALRLGGHSKGGNIAVYAAMNCNLPVQERIIGVYSHDGPGFKEEVFQSAGFQRIKDRLHKTLPQSSLIGMLLQNQEDYDVVQSNRFGIMQHDPFSWSVQDGDFQYAEKITGGAMYMKKTLNQWLATLGDDKRELFVDVLFQVIGAANANTINELSEDWKAGAVAMLGAYKTIDSETKKLMTQTIKALAKISAKNLRPPKKKN